jgi:glycosyltransferase involved in cell wall biosynthesis
MKIAVVSEHVSPLGAPGGAAGGGRAIQVGELAAALAARGHDVTVYTRRASRDGPTQVAAGPGYELRQLDAGPAEPLSDAALLAHLPHFGRELRAAWAASRPQVVHAHYWLAGMAALAAAKDLGIPVVQTFHALGGKRRQPGEDTSPGREQMEGVIAASAAHTIATSADQAAELLRMGVRRRQVTVVPCGVDVGLFRPGPAADSPGQRIVAAGHLSQREGFDVLIGALRRIPSAALVVAGGDDQIEADRLRTVADQLGVGHRVQLLGPVARTDMPALLRSATVVASTPSYEPFGLVPLEAMACGVPVLASAVGGHLDTVIDGVTGRLVPPERPDLTGSALKEVLADPVQLDAFGVAGADRARSRYSWERVAADIVRVYDHVLGVRRAEPETEDVPAS